MKTTPYGFYRVIRLVVRVGVGRRVDKGRDEVVLLVLTF